MMPWPSSSPMWIAEWSMVLSEATSVTTKIHHSWTKWLPRKIAPGWLSSRVLIANR
jgi:hypothetical protein